MSYLKTAPDQQKKFNEDFEDILNPMLDSAHSLMSSQRKLIQSNFHKVNMSASRSQKKKEFGNQQLLVKQFHVKDKQSSGQKPPLKSHKQVDYLFPLLKIAKNTLKYSPSECFNGEEVTITQRISVSKKSNIDIFQRYGSGQKMNLKELQDENIQSKNNSFDDDEDIMEFSQAKKTFQKARKKIQSFKRISEAFRQSTDPDVIDEISVNQNRQHSDKINNLLMDPIQLSKTSSQEFEKKNGINKYLQSQDSIISETNFINQEIQSQNEEIEKVTEFIKHSKILAKIFICVLSILLLLLILAYMKSINNMPVQKSDL